MFTGGIVTLHYFFLINSMKVRYLYVEIFSSSFREKNATNLRNELFAEAGPEECGIDFVVKTLMPFWRKTLLTLSIFIISEMRECPLFCMRHKPSIAFVSDTVKFDWILRAWWCLFINRSFGAASYLVQSTIFPIYIPVEIWGCLLWAQNGIHPLLSHWWVV